MSLRKKRGTHGLAALALISLCIVGLAREALAQEADIKVRAKELVTKGLERQNAARYDEAITFYKAAYDLLPHPELLFNLGQAHRLKGDRVAAFEYYSKYVAIQPNGRGAKEAYDWMSQIERAMKAEAAERQKVRDEILRAERAEAAKTSAKPAEPPAEASAPVKASNPQLLSKSDSAPSESKSVVLPATLFIGGSLLVVTTPYTLISGEWAYAFGALAIGATSAVVGGVLWRRANVANSRRKATSAALDVRDGGAVFSLSGSF